MFDYLKRPKDRLAFTASQGLNPARQCFILIILSDIATSFIPYILLLDAAPSLSPRNFSANMDDYNPVDLEDAS